MSQYFGEPINCDFKGIDGEMASDYCWIHGSTYIPPEHQVTTFFQLFPMLRVFVKTFEFKTAI